MATIVTPNKSDIYEEDIGYRSAVSEELLRKIAASVNAINHNALLPLGSIVHSLLPLENFQALNSNAFVLMAGQDITSTDYGQYLLSEGLAVGTITIPDARGMHLVGVNNERADGKQHVQNPALGGFIEGQVKAHTHTSLAIGANSNQGGTTGGTVPVGGGTTGSTGQSQNTVNAIGVNYFIKVWNNAQP